MAVKTSWYENDSRFIPGHYQPATLIDLGLSRDIDSHRLLRGTGLFHEDILAGTARLSPQQFLGLIGNSRKLLDADDSSFLFGQRLLPGYYGAASHALGHAQNLHQALDILKRLTRDDGALFIGPAEGSLLGRLGMRSIGAPQSFAFCHSHEPVPVARPALAEPRPLPKPVPRPMPPVSPASPVRVRARAQRPSAKHRQHRDIRRARFPGTPPPQRQGGLQHHAAKRSSPQLHAAGHYAPYRPAIRTDEGERPPPGYTVREPAT